MLYSGGVTVLTGKIDKLISQSKTYQKETETITESVHSKIEEDLNGIQEGIISKIKNKFSELKRGLIAQFEENLKSVKENLEASIVVFEREQNKIKDFGLEGNRELINSLNSCMEDKALFVELS